MGVARGIPDALLPTEEPTGKEKDTGLSGGEIAAIVVVILIVAIVTVIVVIGILVFRQRRSRRFELTTAGSDYRHSEGTYVTDTFQSSGQGERKSLLASDVVAMHTTKEDTPPMDTAITNTAALEDEQKGMREKGEEGEMEEKALLTESSKDTHL